MVAMPLSKEDEIFVDASKKLAELAKPFGEFMARDIGKRNAENFRLNAYFFYRFVGRAETLCSLLSEKRDREKCLLPAKKVEEETFEKLRELLSK
jgi:hypothetical protein